MTVRLATLVFAVRSYVLTGNPLLESMSNTGCNRTVNVSEFITIVRTKNQVQPRAYNSVGQTP